MKKKIFAILIALASVFAFTFVSCNDDDEKGGSTDIVIAPCNIDNDMQHFLDSIICNNWNNNILRRDTVYIVNSLYDLNNIGYNNNSINIDFDNYTLILGSVSGVSSSSVISSKQLYYNKMLNTYQYRLTVTTANSGYLVIPNLYFGGIYPKINTSVSLVVNYLND